MRGGGVNGDGECNVKGSSKAGVIGGEGVNVNEHAEADVDGGVNASVNGDSDAESVGGLHDAGDARGDGDVDMREDGANGDGECDVKDEQDADAVDNGDGDADANVMVSGGVVEGIDVCGGAGTGAADSGGCDTGGCDTGGADAGGCDTGGGADAGCADAGGCDTGGGADAGGTDAGGCDTGGGAGTGDDDAGGVDAQADKGVLTLTSTNDGAGAAEDEDGVANVVVSTGAEGDVAREHGLNGTNDDGVILVALGGAVDLAGSEDAQSNDGAHSSKGGLTSSTNDCALAEEVEGGGANEGAEANAEGDVAEEHGLSGADDDGVLLVVELGGAVGLAGGEDAQSNDGAHSGKGRLTPLTNDCALAEEVKDDSASEDAEADAEGVAAEEHGLSGADGDGVVLVALGGAVGLAGGEDAQGNDSAHSGKGKLTPLTNDCALAKEVKDDGASEDAEADAEDVATEEHGLSGADGEGVVLVALGGAVMG